MTQHPNGDPSVPQVLMVDRDSDWNGFMGKALKGAGLDHKTVADADAAIEVLAQEDTEIASVVTDGLRGKWPQVAEAAIEAGIMPVVVTRSSFPLSGAAEMGVPSFGKQELQDNSLALGRLIKLVKP